MQVQSIIPPLLDKLTVPIHEAEAEAWLDHLTQPKRPVILSFLNAHAVNLSCKDPGLRQALLDSDILLRDGSGVKVMMKMTGREPGLNLNGTDLIPQIIDRFASLDGKRIAVFGTANPWLFYGCEAITGRGGDVVSMVDGFQEPDAYVQAAKETSPDLIILAMGMPKQELVSLELRSALDHPAVIVNGGAVIDFMAGKVTRAPAWMRGLGIEWLYRLFREPKRLFRRYVVGNVMFLYRALVLKFSTSPSGSAPSRT